MSDTDENRPTLEGSFWLGLGGSAWLSDLRVRLLEAIESRGSLTGAAQAIGISYKSAWEQVEAMTNLADRPLVIRRSGGAGGGGAELTDEARALLRWYDTVAVEPETDFRQIVPYAGGDHRPVDGYRRLSPPEKGAVVAVRRPGGVDAKPVERPINDADRISGVPPPVGVDRPGGDVPSDRRVAA